MRLIGVAGRDRKPRGRADRGQGFAAKAERADGDKIVVRELRSGMAFDRKGQIREQTTSQGGGPLGDPAHLKPLIESLLAEGAAPKTPVKSGDTKKNSEKKTTEKKASE